MLFRITLLALAAIGMLAGVVVDVHANGTPITAFPSAYTLTQPDVEAAAAKALVEKGAGARIKAILLGNRTAVLYQSVKPVAPKLTSLNFDHNTSRWTANLLVTSGEDVLTAIPVGGRYVEVVQRPVLKRQVRSGETIGQNDIETLEFPVALTRNDEITDPKLLLGMGPRTVISPRRPIRASEISTPAVVHKNDIVTMTFSSGGVEISTGGQAMSEGSQGAMIEVRNLASKNIVRAMVEDAHTVSVNPPPPPEKRELAGVPYAPIN